jgi:UDP-N-acetyl-D-glucosamine dehydrogenase
MAGIKVQGFDIDESKIANLNAGRSIIKHVPHEQVKALVDSKKFHATSDMSKIRNVDCVLICVPTPLTKQREPDMQYVEKSCLTIGQYLQKGQLISSSTTYPGTTRELMQPILERTGLKAGKDFYMAFSPEREDPGNKHYTTKTIPKIVGGLTPTCRKLACDIYRLGINTVVPVSSVEAAEATKILENVYRCINIAMVNELKVVFDRMGIDVWEVTGPDQALGFHPSIPLPAWAATVSD